MLNASSTHDTDLTYLFIHQQLYHCVVKLRWLLQHYDLCYFLLALVAGMAACTCYQLVTVLINIIASGVQIYYCAPGLKLSRVSHYTAEWVNSDMCHSAVLP